MKPDFQIDKVKAYNVDCMEFMKELPDNYYDLAIVDPPYGIKASNKPIQAGKWKREIHKPKDWDSSIPDKQYFLELFRVSNNQIMWGGNYYLEYLKNTPCFIVWDKKLENGWLADCELAWTSFKTQVKKFTRHHIQDHNDRIKRIHPTQKPVALYKWLLTNYAKEGDKILDTHGGSMTHARACLDLHFDLDICELDKEYFDKAVEGLKNNNQLYLF